MLPKPQSEQELLARIARHFRYNLAPNPRAISLGIGDDAALVRPTAGCEQVLTCDWFLEGTHFRADKHPPDAVGWKCLARAISDIAAMGGRPLCFLLSLGLPQKNTGQWLDNFLKGLRRAAKQFACPLAGGDTTRQAETLINVTVVGEVPKGHALRRSGARPDDIIYVSGRLGEAEFGWQILRKSAGLPRKKKALTRKHLYPEPRLELGRWLMQKKLASAMTDLSDGLSSDLPKLCFASSAGATIDPKKIPRVRIPAHLERQGYDPEQLALHGGDDYELLFTVPPQKAGQLPHTFRSLPLSPIGRITHTRKILAFDENGKARPLPARGWDPFRR